jgi:nitrile hydratase
MNGIHDMGGQHGFGKVEVEADEPVFHERWEARVFGIVRSFGGGNIDAGRHSLERLDPVTYLENGYYGRWFAALVRTLVGAGALSEDEIASRMKEPAGAKPKEGKRGEVARQPQPVNYEREIDAPRLFRIGDEVVTRNHQPAGHTRLPAYARCRRGVIVFAHPAMVFPDDNAHGRGENPQYLYTVCFAGRELWGDQAEAETSVHLDLFESYLAPVEGAASDVSRD